MSRNKYDREREDHQDTFDRAFVGKPGFMIILTLVVIIGSIIFNYFK
ncbi:hypothetical protein [Oceanobacillus manasiensis]|nr:hypothetical protein [Oceanobacillus manasiensis]